MRSLLTVWLCLFIATMACAQEKRDENETVTVHEIDPAMVEAIREARSTLNHFLELAAAPPAGTSGYKLKVLIEDLYGAEHFWVDPFRQVEDGFIGQIANEPRIVKSVKWGQQIKFSRQQITDWGYIKNGRQVGSYTVCVLFKKVPKDQADYYRKNHGFDC